MNSIFTLFAYLIPALWNAATHEIPAIANRLYAWVEPHTQRYFWHLCLLALFAILMPIFMVALDITLDIAWLTALAGVLLALILGILLLRPVYMAIALVLGVSWQVIHLRLHPGTAIDVGIAWAKTHLNIVAGVLLWELLIVFYLTVFPTSQNPRALPIVALCALLLALMGYYWGMKGIGFRKIIFSFVVIFMIFQTSSFVFPNAARAIGNKFPGWDNALTEWVKSPSFPSWGAGHSAARASRNSLKRETLEVQLHPGVWTAAIYPPPTTRRYHINAPDGTIIQYSTGAEKTLPCSLGKKPRGAKWFKLRHPTQGGEVVVVFDKV
jgi:hypothetical protein